MKKLIIIANFMLFWISANAQFLDSLQIQAGTFGTAASNNYQPLWMVSNRFGIVADRKTDFSSHIRLSNINRLGAPMTIYDRDDRGIYFSYGVDVYNNNHFQKNIVQEAFLKVNFKNLTFSGGRFKQIIGEVDHDLSSGSLGVSGNALPIPKLNLALDYSDVPFTNGWLQVKGMISHGWMGNHQFMKEAFLHEKNLYFRLGKRKLKFYGGIQHYVVWGGSREGFAQTDRSFSGFLNVLTGIEANDGSVAGNILPNRPGDHRGIIEVGAEWENDAYKFQLNNQTPFDSGQGIDIRNIDRLLSFNITNKNPESWWQKIVFEFMHTTQSNDFYSSRYRESYYNNGVYRTGWEYQDQIIGTPLFTNRVRTSKYFPEVIPFDWDGDHRTIYPLANILNNRVIGAHAGIIYSLTEDISSKTMFTYTKNFGDFRQAQYYPFKIQWYSLQQIHWSLPNSPLSISGAIAYDFGDLSSNFGSMIGIQWQLKK